MADVTASPSEQDLSFFRAEFCCFGPVHDPELASKGYKAGQEAFDNKTLRYSQQLMDMSLAEE
jgi:hypothetical protein